MKMTAVLFLPILLAGALGAEESTLVTVNSVDITWKEVELTVANLGRGKFYHGSTAENRKEQMTFDAMNQLVVSTLMAEQAMREGIHFADEKIEEIIRGMKGEITDDEFAAALQQQGLEVEELRRRIGRNADAQAYQDQLLASAGPVSEQECKAFYEENSSMFETGTRYHVFMITAKIPPQRDPESIQKARSLLQNVRQRLDSGSSFEDLAKEYSQDEFSANGGDMGTGPLALFPEELQGTIQGMKPGTVSDEVVTIYGLHLLKVAEIEPSKKLDYDSVYGDILKILSEKKTKGIIEQETTRLIKEADITIHDQVLARKFAEKYNLSTP